MLHSVIMTISNLYMFILFRGASAKLYACALMHTPSVKKKKGQPSYGWAIIQIRCPR